MVFLYYSILGVLGVAHEVCVYDFESLAGEAFGLVASRSCDPYQSGADDIFGECRLSSVTRVAYINVLWMGYLDRRTIDRG